MDEDSTADGLRRIEDFEATRRTTPLTRLLRKVAPTRGFAAVYRRVGPTVDPWVMRRSGGKIASRVYGLPVLLLTTEGRRSGARRVSPLLYVRDGPDFVVVGTNFGQHAHPGWTANLLARSEAEVQVGPVRIPVRAEQVDRDTWARLWPSFLDVYPGYQAYLSRTGGRQPRMFRLRPIA